MSPDMVAALERQTTTTPTSDNGTQHRWALIAEGVSVDLVAYEGYGLVSVAWMGAHSSRPFTVAGEVADLHKPCRALDVDAWCWIDCSPGDRLMDAWATDRDAAPIWAALEQLAGEIQW